MLLFMAEETLEVWLRFLWCRDYPEFSKCSYGSGAERDLMTKEKEMWWWKQDTKVKLFKEGIK